MTKGRRITKTKTTCNIYGKEMQTTKYVSDVLTVSFDNGLNDESALCISRKLGEKTIILKMELGEQADILYRLLTEQMTKAEIKAENKGEWIAYDHGMGLVYLKCPFCGVFIDKRYVEHNFCGKCGAKLSGEKSGFEGVSE